MGGEFTHTLTADELRSLGLDKLTPEQLAALDQRIEQYKNGARARPLAQFPAPSPESLRTAPAASTAAPAPAVAAPKQPDARSGKILPEWVGALITLKRAESSAAKPQVLETSIVGKFSGWTGRTEFKLENGQVWAQANNDSYRYTPPLTDPKVRIFPASFGSFWMEIEGVGQRCRVRPVRLE